MATDLDSPRSTVLAALRCFPTVNHGREAELARLCPASLPILLCLKAGQGGTAKRPITSTGPRMTLVSARGKDLSMMNVVDAGGMATKTSSE
jgi:hypothetical protein